MSGNYELIPAEAHARWRAVLAKCCDYDTYHLPEYHQLSKVIGEGQGWLFSYSEGEHTAAFPLVTRSIPDVDKWSDATSVYGYPGPVASLHEPDLAFAQRFQAALKVALHQQQVLSVFSRLHPIVNTNWLLEGLGEVVLHGPTVWIDMGLSEEEQLAGARTEHRRILRQARERYPMVCREDPEFKELPRFVELYEETMKRNGAEQYYFFPRPYYDHLVAHMPKAARLFVTELEGKIISATIVLVTNAYLQFHLNGTATEFMRTGCVRFSFDMIRKWGKLNGLRWFNLGGGVGGKDGDSLFQFKAGFSKLRFPFCTARIVVDQEAYDQLTAKHKVATDKAAEFFPRYRA